MSLVSYMFLVLVIVPCLANNNLNVKDFSSESISDTNTPSGFSQSAVVQNTPSLVPVSTKSPFDLSQQIENGTGTTTQSVKSEAEDDLQTESQRYFGFGFGWGGGYWRPGWGYGYGRPWGWGYGRPWGYHRSYWGWRRPGWGWGRPGYW